MSKPEYADNLLEVVFKNGKLMKEENLITIRNRLHNGQF